MNRSFLILLATSLALLAQKEEAVDPERVANTVILQEISIRNLGLKVVETVETDFENTIFAIGRIEEIPSNHSVLSSRIPGRIVELGAIAGDQVVEGQILVKVESRQPGDPPPTITLTAPISGLVADSHVRLGEPVEPEKELLDIIDLSEVWAVARVPEQEAGRVKIGSNSRIRIAALPDQVFTGDLIRFGTTADQRSGTLDAIFRIENRDLQLRPGMRAEFSIITDSRSDVMAVPLDAIQGDTANQVVYVKDFDIPNAFIRTPVHTGARNDRYIEIINGLFPGDEVVTEGSYFLGFAGGSGLSLKDALDAAHGHPHNEDGTIMTPEQVAGQAGDGGHADHPARSGLIFYLLAFTSGFFLILLIISGIKNAQAHQLIRQLEARIQASDHPAATSESDA